MMHRNISLSTFERIFVANTGYSFTNTTLCDTAYYGLYRFIVTVLMLLFMIIDKT